VLFEVRNLETRRVGLVKCMDKGSDRPVAYADESHVDSGTVSRGATLEDAIDARENHFSEQPPISIIQNNRLTSITLCHHTINRSGYSIPNGLAIPVD
jgi:hypothetical protein